MISCSVVITCYNEGLYLRRAIESVLNQSDLEPISEIIIVDDGSTDNSRDVIKTLASENALIKALMLNNGGVSKARNKGVEISKSDYIAFLDADDFWVVDKLKRQIECFENSPDAILVYTSFYIGDNNNKKKKCNNLGVGFENQLVNLIVKTGPVLPSTVLFKKNVFIEVGGFDESLMVAEDSELWIRMIQHGSFELVDKALIHKIDKPNSLNKHAQKRMDAYINIFNRTAENYEFLEKYRCKVMSRLCMKSARSKIKSGQVDEGLMQLRESISYYPFNITSLVFYLYYLLIKK